MAWDTTNTNNSGASSITYSNSNNTVLHAGGASTVTNFVDDNPTIYDAIGSTLYLEIALDDIASASNISVGYVTSSLISASYDGTSFTEGAGFTSLTGNPVSVEDWITDGPDALNQTTSTLSMGDESGRQFTWADGDVIGILISYGSYSSPAAIDFTIYRNGQYLITVPMQRWDDAQWGDIEIIPYISMDVGAVDPAQFTLRTSSSDWEYEPLDAPWKQEWTATISEPAVNNADTGYCRMMVPDSLIGNNYDNTLWGIFNHGLSLYSFESDSGIDEMNAVSSTVRSAGKYYFEVTMDDLSSDASGTRNGPDIGVTGSFTGDTSFLGGSDTCTMGYNFDRQASGGNEEERLGIGTTSTGQLPGFANNSTPPTPATWSTGDVIMVAVDLSENLMRAVAQSGGQTFTTDDSKIFIGKNGTWGTNNDPAVPANQDDATDKHRSPGAWRVYLGSGPINSFWKRMTINFGAQDFTYTIPTGYEAWDSTPLPVNATTTTDIDDYVGKT